MKLWLSKESYGELERKRERDAWHDGFRMGFGAGLALMLISFILNGILQFYVWGENT